VLFRSSSTDYHRNRLAVINLDEKVLAEDSRGVPKWTSGSESPPIVHRRKPLNVDEALLEALELSGSRWSSGSQAALTRYRLMRSPMNDHRTTKQYLDTHILSCES
jgi:hypothetical protein